MSLAEIKKTLTEMGVEERLEIAAFIAHINQANDPDYQAELALRMAEMDKGKKFSLDQLIEAHADLERQGR